MTFRVLAVSSFALTYALSPAVADAASTGGAAAPDAPRIESVRCVSSEIVSCPSERTAPAGAQVQVLGRGLDHVRAVTFRGARGRRDDVTVKPAHLRPSHLEAAVPAAARSGRVELRGTDGSKTVSPAKLDVVATPPPAGAGPDDHVFPIRGKHDLGQTATNRYGGGRNHQGQDLFASCGTPLVAAQGGTVKYAGSQARAGNYIVITGKKSGWDYVYMHMRRPPLASKGDTVQTGQPIGEVGDTGNAQGCHLHFELWKSPGWYSGGSTFDPLPLLRAWQGRR